MNNTGDLDYSNTTGLDDRRVSKRDHNDISDNSATEKQPPQKQVRIDEPVVETLKKDIEVDDLPDPSLLPHLDHLDQQKEVHQFFSSLTNLLKMFQRSLSHKTRLDRTKISSSQPDLKRPTET